MVKASERKMMAQEVIANRDVSISLICRTFSISETCYRYQAKLNSDNEKIANLLLALTQNQRNWGLVCASYIYAMLKTILGIISVFIVSIGS